MTVASAARSLRVRLLIATLVTLILALYGSHLWLASLFHDHAQAQFDGALGRQLDQLTARINRTASGALQLDARGLSDPRLERPFSGLYWQVDQIAPIDSRRTGVLRSRSLWDEQLELAHDALVAGLDHAHDLTGPRGQVLRALERRVSDDLAPNQQWRLIVAADQSELVAAISAFKDLLSASLVGLGSLLALAALAQVTLGLAPLRTLQSALRRLREGRSSRLEGDFPTELRALIEDFNTVLQDRQDILTRAQTQAGNLAHALKTPLTILGHAAQQSPESPLSPLVKEQVELARRHVDWHLTRARAAATQSRPKSQVPVKAIIDQLTRVIRRLHQDRPIELDIQDITESWTIAADPQDLQEMLGNLLDNACRSARTKVSLIVSQHGDDLLIDIDDDGPGISSAQRQAVLQRGVRLDESTPGSGLGLAIVLELAQLHAGGLELSKSRLGGLRARLRLPVGSPTQRLDQDQEPRAL